MSIRTSLGICVVVLAIGVSAASAQMLYIGPLNQPPIDPSKCVPSPDGQTAVCFANDGVHVSIAGAPFGPPLPAQAPVLSIGTVKPGNAPDVTMSGTPSNPVLNFVLQQGPPGAPGVVQIGGVVTLGNVSINCPKGQGTIQAGWKANSCTLSGTVTDYQPPQ